MHTRRILTPLSLSFSELNTYPPGIFSLQTSYLIGDTISEVLTACNQWVDMFGVFTPCQLISVQVNKTTFSPQNSTLCNETVRWTINSLYWSTTEPQQNPKSPKLNSVAIVLRYWIFFLQWVEISKIKNSPIDIIRLLNLGYCIVPRKISPWCITL